MLPKKTIKFGEIKLSINHYFCAVHDKYISRNTNSVYTNTIHPKEKHKMFKKLKELLQGVITKTNRQSALESFISSKNPTSPAEIEHWVRTFDRQSGGRYGY